MASGFRSTLIAGMFLVAVGAGGTSGWLSAQEEPAPTPATNPVKPSAVRPVPVKKATPEKKPTKPARMPKGKAAKLPAVATTIVQELKREFELGKLRRVSDYFEKSPNAEMTSDVIVGMLQRRLGSSNSMDGYIKWQLLSGVPQTMPEQLAGDAIAAYRNAPGLDPRPGMGKDQQRELDKELRRADDPADLNSRLINEARHIGTLNEPVIQYRGLLFDKLPDSYDALEAGLADVYVRCQAAAEVRNFATHVAGRITEWAQTTENAADLDSMVGVVNDLIAAPMPVYYEGVRHDREQNASVWNSQTPNPNDGRRLEDVTMALSRRLGTLTNNQGRGNQDRKRK